jgi:multidrug resistance protein, MATE family
MAQGSQLDQPNATQPLTAAPKGLWASEIWPTFKLAAPIMMARLGITLMFVVDSIMVGQARGIELAYLGQALAAQSVLMLICIGLLQGSMVLSSQAFGAKDFAECGRVWKTALIVAVVMGGLAALASLMVERFLLWTGTEPALATGAGIVSSQFAWGMPGMLLYIASNYFLETVKRPYFGVMIMAICNLVNLLADGILVGGWFGIATPAGAEMAVITTSAVRWLAFALALTVIFAAGEGRRYAVFETLGPVWPRMKKLLRLGAPIALMLGADQGAFSAMAILAGHLGKTVAAAQLMSMNLNGIFFMTIVGLSAATNIRVGHAVGAGDAPEAARAGWSGIGIGAGITAAIGAIFLVTPSVLAGIYTSDVAILEVARLMIMAGALMLVFDGTVTVTSGALRGRGDTLKPALIHIACLWLIGVPMSYVCTFVWDWGPPGLVLGLTLGMAVSCAVLLWRHHGQTQKGVRRA